MKLFEYVVGAVVIAGAILAIIFQDAAKEILVPILSGARQLLSPIIDRIF
jgi:hypothetical protein